MSVKRCNKCGGEVDINNGGCAMMIAFCHNHSTSLSNTAFCRDCYEKYIEQDLFTINANADLGMVIDEEGAT